MYKIRLRESRGRTMTDWADCAHTFSYAQYFDPFNMGFSDLRIINDNIIKPQGNIDFRTQSNMEIINIVLEGELEYKANSTYSKILKPGDVQLISSGWGLKQSEFNSSYTDFLHFLQIWILPYKKNIEPKISSLHFENSEMTDKLKLIVSGSGKNKSLKINQDVDIYRCRLSVNNTINYDLPPNRKVWIQVVFGAIEINSNILEAGDGISIVNERGYLDINGVEKTSDFLIFSLRNLHI